MRTSRIGRRRKSQRGYQSRLLRGRIEVATASPHTGSTAGGVQRVLSDSFITILPELVAM